VQGAGRFFPEVLYFLNDVLLYAVLCNVALPKSSKSKSGGSVSALAAASSSFDRQVSDIALLAIRCEKRTESDGEIPPFQLLELFATKPADDYFESNIFKYYLPFL
jgi:hypothetical protein